MLPPTAEDPSTIRTRFLLRRILRQLTPAAQSWLEKLGTAQALINAEVIGGGDQAAARERERYRAAGTT
eukprot:CAMPEP_0202768724 /NCGR_PEP_ID=MMETSP1388-20130828/35253_1 /ASSEMBLY_ACC=CAM_ASM_000864 /TAXON_ID=37098 /ORGANISM="Isochrysis sp, Strain CCMP1244" /LENGTH=68 /DNA_ID=CAMNT_0049437473 /DNA_START=1 /DNA_END=204 /DNA_ORIENTATION=+